MLEKSDSGRWSQQRGWRESVRILRLGVWTWIVVIASSVAAGWLTVRDNSPIAIGALALGALTVAVPALVVLVTLIVAQNIDPGLWPDPGPVTFGDRLYKQPVGHVFPIVGLFFVVFMVQAAADWMWESTAVAVLALGAPAIANLAASSPRVKNQGDATKSVGILVASAMAVIVMLPGVSNKRQINGSQAAFRDGDDTKALNAADNAISAESWSATAYGQGALALEASGDLDGARDAVEAAESKEPYNWRWPFVESQISVKLGDTSAATKAFARARELRWYSALFGEEPPPIR